MSLITAVTLTEKGGFIEPAASVRHLVVRCGLLLNAAALQRAYLSAIEKVASPYFFFLDYDDELPFDADTVLATAVDSQTDMAFTDEVIRFPDAPEVLRKSAVYSQALHLADPLLVHHLTLYRTEAAQAALSKIPRGDYWQEMALSWEVAKTGPVSYIPLTGYVWNCGSQGAHAQASTLAAVARTRQWCKDNP